MSPLSSLLQTLINSALSSIDPYRLTYQHLNQKKVKTELKRFKNIYVIGFGKAGYKMAVAAEEALGSYLTAGYVNIPKPPPSNKLKKITLQLASHPLPRAKNIAASQKIVALAQKAQSSDLVICLISGGGSALLTLPAPPLKLSDIKQTFDLLIRQTTASINEINIIRKHLSQVKGGRLAEICHPAKVHSLIISDVVNNDLSTISSGPTYPDTSTFSDAWSIIKKYKLENKLSAAVKRYLQQGKDGIIPDTPKPNSPIFQKGKVKNIIIGDSHTALIKLKQTAASLGLKPIILPDFLQGEVKKCANKFTGLLQQASANSCLIASGETVVRVKGKGQGGRNQEFVLQILKKMPKKLLKQIELASLGTDGIDGFCPTEVAGAYANYKLYQQIKKQGLDIVAFQKNNDSYHFFKKINGHIITGPTGTNVGDLVVAVKF